MNRPHLPSSKPNDSVPQADQSMCQRIDITGLHFEKTGAESLAVASETTRFQRPLNSAAADTNLWQNNKRIFDPFKTILLGVKRLTNPSGKAPFTACSKEKDREQRQYVPDPQSLVVRFSWIDRPTRDLEA